MTNSDQLRLQTEDVNFIMVAIKVTYLYIIIPASLKLVAASHVAICIYVFPNKCYHINH